MLIAEKLKKICKILSHRLVIVGLALVLQLACLIVFFCWFSNYSVLFYGFCIVLAILSAIKIISGDSNPAYKIAWLVPVLLVPIFGVIIYLVFGRLRFSKKEFKRRRDVLQYYSGCLSSEMSISDCFSADTPKTVSGQANYLQNYAGFPIYKDCYTEFFPLGEYKFQSMLNEIAKAKHFIFLEYFIVQEGRMWDTILDLLEQKAKEGVEVRMLYDDLGCLFTLPGGYYQKVRAKGIQCYPCNAFVPILTSYHNNRDHRKILVIDGHTGYTGGINLADEYINEYEKHGHWKDCAIMIKGKAVESLTAMFLSMWDVTAHTGGNFIDYCYERYAHEMQYTGQATGLIAPYGDSPVDDELVGENVYFNIISTVSDYLYIETPYLILDNDMKTALCNAAKRGVDVRIITPHIEDKWYVHIVTRSYYAKLMKAGVKIYEYTPGFIHAKVFVSDDSIATVGTVNLDYRSLYLHYECGCWMYKSNCIMDVKKDFEETLEKCQRISQKDLDAQPLWKKLLCPILKAFAPLM